MSTVGKTVKRVQSVCLYRRHTSPYSERLSTKTFSPVENRKRRPYSALTLHNISTMPVESDLDVVLIYPSGVIQTVDVKSDPSLQVSSRIR